MTAPIRFGADAYGEGYWERAEGSNYTDYADDPGWSKVLAAIGHFYPTPGSLVEAACSKGYFILHAMEHGWDAYGFDLSEYAISKAPPVVADRVAVHDAIDPWPYEGEAYDIVCSWEFLEHIDHEFVPRVLTNMMLALRPGGELWLKIGIEVPTDHDFAGQEDHDHTHVNMRPRRYWEDLFAFAGLEHQPEREAMLDMVFADRDWKGRFFVWQRPVPLTD